MERNKMTHGKNGVPELEVIAVVPVGRGQGYPAPPDGYRAIVEAAADARYLLSRLSSRIEIIDELHAEIIRVEQRLWDALFPAPRA